MTRLVALSILIAGCHVVHPPTVDDGNPSVGDGGTISAGDGAAISVTRRAQAVTDTIGSNSACTALPSFYWEIGDADGKLASGTVGSAYDAQSEMSIASASKWLWGAYVVERFKSDSGMIDDAAMTMRSGYVSLTYDSCIGTRTVQDCFAAGMNSTHTAADDGMFYYNGGHFQKYAVDLGLGGDDDAALEAELKKYLGTDLTFTFGSPQLAGGIHTSAADYAVFLRKILKGELAIAQHLDMPAVCTLPSACPQAVYSPSPYAWHYGYAHWIEDEPGSGDGAFSSPGAFGFYPWIDAGKQFYGILARYSLDKGAYIQSAQCGRLLRKAFLTGTVQ